VNAHRQRNIRWLGLLLIHRASHYPSWLHFLYLHFSWASPLSFYFQLYPAARGKHTSHSFQDRNFEEHSLSRTVCSLIQKLYVDLYFFVSVNTLAQSRTIPIVSMSLSATLFQIWLDIVLPCQSRLSGLEQYHKFPLKEWKSIEQFKTTPRRLQIPRSLRLTTFFLASFLFHNHSRTQHSIFQVNTHSSNQPKTQRDFFVRHDYSLQSNQDDVLIHRTGSPRTRNFERRPHEDDFSSSLRKIQSRQWTSPRRRQ
jgi:hypothetical protein